MVTREQHFIVFQIETEGWAGTKRRVGQWEVDCSKLCLKAQYIKGPIFAQSVDLGNDTKSCVGPG